MINEIWKPVVGYEGLYEVSNYGNVKALNFNRTGQERLMKPHILKNGYVQVEFKKDGERKCFKIHRLVWEAFTGPIPEGMEVNHINEDKTDNRLRNLNLMSKVQNCNWGTRNKRISKAHNKQIVQYDLEGNELKVWDNAKEMCELYGWSSGAISEACSGKRKSAYGFKWVYKE